MRCSRRQLQGGQELLQGQVALALVFNLTSFASVLLPINTYTTESRLPQLNDNLPYTTRQHSCHLDNQQATQLSYTVFLQHYCATNHIYKL